MRCKSLEFLVICSIVLHTSPGAAQSAPTIVSYRDIHHPIFAEHGMVSTQEELASRVGLEVLRNGGNAIDSAVAVGFTLAVTLPRAGNLGGGGFMLIHSAKQRETVALDYRETAPAASTRDMYLDGQGNVDKDKSRYSYQSVGVPGTVAGLTLALEKYGTWPLSKVLEPAIRLAEKGFIVRKDLADSLAYSEKKLSKWPSTAKIFLKPDGTAYQSGDRLIQSDLAWSLEQIAKHGPTAFYEGEVATRIVADMEAGDGLIDAEDLRSYRSIIRRPIEGTYRGYEILSMPPPSSGGVHLVQILNILEDFPIGFLGVNSADTIHLMAEAMKMAYADRSRHLGDPDYWDLPISGITSKR